MKFIPVVVLCLALSSLHARAEDKAGIAISHPATAPGVGSIANPVEWARKHQKDTLRLRFPEWMYNERQQRVVYVSDTPSTLPASSDSRDLPKGWVLLSGDRAYWAVFNRTGSASVSPAALAPKEFPTKEDQFVLGIPEHVMAKADQLRDFEWTRELDGALIHYRVVRREHENIIFEVWEQEWPSAKPAIDAFLYSLDNQ